MTNNSHKHWKQSIQMWTAWYVAIMVPMLHIGIWLIWPPSVVSHLNRLPNHRNSLKNCMKTGLHRCWRQACMWKHGVKVPGISHRTAHRAPGKSLFSNFFSLSPTPPSSLFSPLSLFLSLTLSHTLSPPLLLILLSLSSQTLKSTILLCFSITSVKFSVWNIKKVNINDVYAFPTTDDHSKWAVSNDTSGWICVGDINRAVRLNESFPLLISHYSLIIGEWYFFAWRIIFNDFLLYFTFSRCIKPSEAVELSANSSKKLPANIVS